MANQKKLQKAAIKFRKENKPLYKVYSFLLSHMANYIRTSGCTEVTARVKNHKLRIYESA